MMLRVCTAGLVRWVVFDFGPYASDAARRRRGIANGRVPQDQPSNTHTSVLHISEADGLPQTRTVRLGKNKSMLIEMPRDLRDVMVSAPEIVDAVVQTSNRVHLIGKKIGPVECLLLRCQRRAGPDA